MNEIDLVERIRTQAGKSTLELGIGDDCAIYRPRANEDLLFTTDYLIEDVHFRRDLFPPDAVGHKALARSLSDIAAMGGEPRFCLLSLALPPSADQVWINQFLKGFLKLAKRCDTALAGGDLSRASKVTCDVMVCGAVPYGKALRRDGAQAGDWIYVSGPLGKPWQTHQRPEPRLDLAKALRGRATSCIDLSDGISADLSRLIKASGVGATLTHVPVVKGSTLDQALHGGEDYELLYTMPKRRKPLAGSIQVGEITDGPFGQIEFQAGALEPLGHDHFRESVKKRGKR
jgi:thiamine-monophosphate kinase